ncbi:MAG: endonuclease III [Candidatus Omnitrophota bacterium]
MSNILKTITLIEKQAKSFNIPWVTIESRRRDPFRVLISCILSLRTKDKTTEEASNRLFKVAAAPVKILTLSASRIQKLIYPVGFYRTKAKVILGISKKLLTDFKGRVPDNIEGLLSLKGVGRKTANLVLGLGYNIPAICVDTHVHRISNRLGWIRTKKPHATEEALQKIIPKSYWIRLNTVLVAFGQNLCLPVSPFCSRCYVNNICKRAGVARSR